MTDTTKTLIDVNGNPLGLRLPTRDIARQFAFVSRPMPQVVSAPTDIPKSFAIPGWKQDDQRQRNFCHAHAATAAAEGTYFIATKKVRQFSRRFSGICNMRRDGSDRSDHGASIESSAMVLLDPGSCPEESLPYFADGDRYSNNIPSNCFDLAEEFRCRSVFRAQSFDQFDRAITSGWGFGLFGTEWSNRWANVRTERFGKEVLGDGGGHALSHVRWQTYGGERWYGVDNSHAGWGYQGQMFSFADPQLIDWLCRNSIYGVYVVSDMAVDGDDQPLPKRSWDWVHDANFASGGTQL